MAGTNCCQRGLKSLISGKLGRCPRCIRAATIGTLAAWAVAAALYGVWPIPALLWISLLVAGGFTLLLFAHLVAFTARLIALRQAIAHGDTMPAVELSRGRRAATAQVLRVGLAALLASVFGVGLVGRPGTAQAAKCEEKHELDPFKTETEEFCAPNLTSAKAQADAKLTKKLKKFAQGQCEPFATEICKKCNLKSVEDTESFCDEIGSCTGANKHWRCRKHMTSFTCQCGGSRYVP